MDKPTTITAFAFFDENYERKVRANECNVTDYDGFQLVTFIARRPGQTHIYDIKGNLHIYSDKQLFNVEWLTPAAAPPQPVAADVGAGLSASRLLLAVHEDLKAIESGMTGDLTASNVATIALGKLNTACGDLLERESELTTARQQLAEARTLLVDVHRNAPQQEPEQYAVRLYPIAHSFWQTGKKIHAFLSGEGKQS